MKILSALSIGLLGSSVVWAVDKGQWQINGSYANGDTATNLGKLYECLVSGWCSGGNELYEPGVHKNEWAWSTAWKEVGPEPLPIPPKDITIPIKVSGDIPTQAQIIFTGSLGTFSAFDGQVTLKYSEEGSTTYIVNLKDDDGSISPNKITISENTSTIDLKYTVKPTPIPSDKCDSIPSNILNFIPNGQDGHWGGYSKGDFVKYEGDIYELLDTYWTADAPGTPNTWIKCGSVISADVNVKTNGLPSNIKRYPLTIDGKEHNIDIQSSVSITLGKGNHYVSVKPIISSSDVNNYYEGTPNPKNIDVTENSTVNLTVNFVKKPIEQANVYFNVYFPEEAKPTSILNATISNNNGTYSKQIIIGSGDNTIEIPSKGEFIVKPDSYTINDTKYVAPPITIVDGKISGDNQIKYAKDDLILATYMPVSWNNSPTISVAAEHGYNIVIPSFIEVKGNSDIQFTGDTFIPYTTWNYKASDPKYIEIIKDDVTLAKNKYHLKYVLASVGGENNTYDPGANVNYDDLAQKTVTFLDKYGFDGIDFDLEATPVEVTQDSLATFIKALKKQKSDIIISGAPQVNNVNGKLDYVNTGVSQVYTKAINDGLFNYLFVQEYNTGGNYVNSKGDSCTKGDQDCYDQTNAGFIKNSYYALDKLTPKTTKIVAGQPATKAAAGAATVFNGVDSSDPFKAMCDNYMALNGQTQYGGAMNWEVSYDKGNNYEFADMFKHSANNTCNEM